MISKNRGFSLTVLIIAIAVILIITTTAILSIKDFDKDKDISNFMSDLENVKQYVIEYYAHNDTLPVKIENGTMISAETELIDLFTEKKVLSQLNSEDTGDYYYVDINKLGKIHLNDYERGYIINEGSLNVYVTKPCVYEGTEYYTLTSYLLGKNISANSVTDFQITVMGNPITWSKEAEILVSIPNVNIGETDGWNFKWGKTSEITSGENSRINYFTYGDTITIRENGIYTIIVENPQGKSIERKVVISKIDNVPPVVMYSDGQLYINDAETGVADIRCKIKETSRFEIDDATREKYPEYYTKTNENYTNTPEELVDNYLWGDEKIKGSTVEEYLKTYEEYYEKISRYNAVLANSASNSGERENANIAIKELNSMYPQFAYNNRRFSDTERNIVIYVEDEAGNGAVYSALSRGELRNCEYISGDSNTLLDSKVTINNNDRYTNKQEVTLFLQSMYAKSVFVTEEKVPTATWIDFDRENMDFELSEGDGEKIVYAFFRDQAGKIASAYDKIHLDTTSPSDNKPTVEYDDETGLSILVNQTDTNIVNGVETQSGLTGVYQFGIKAETDSNYIWYPRVSSIPKLNNGTTYSIVTKATDRAGNEQVSNPASLNVKSNTALLTSLKVGDYVNYGELIEDSTYTTDTSKTGYTSAQSLSTGSAKWRVLSIDGDNIMITTNGIVNSGTYLQGATGYFNGAEVLNNICKALYSSTTLGLEARSMTVEDLNKACGYMPEAMTYSNRFAFYPYSSGSQSGTTTYNGKTYQKVQHNNGTYPNGRFLGYDGGGTNVGTENGYSFVETSDSTPVYVTRTYYGYNPSSENSKVGEILGSDYGWLASPCVFIYKNTGESYDARLEIRRANSSMVRSNFLYGSSGSERSCDDGIRPVVTLNSTIQLDVTDATYNGSSEEKPWKLIKK